jgi:hypothetical protein
MSLATLFDYAALDAETRIVVQQKTGEIRERVRRTRQDVIEIGERLIEVKERLGHGNFGKWLRAEFDWADRTAQSFMCVAEAFKSAIIADLDITPTALQGLAAPSVPDEARSEAIRRARDGEHIGSKKAKEITGKYSPAPAPKPAPRPGLFDEEEEDEQQRRVESRQPDPSPGPEEEETGEDLDEGEEESFDSDDDPEPTTDPAIAADKWNARIKRLRNDIFLIANSIPRRGGIAKLTESWPRKSVKVTVQYLMDLRETTDQCIRELKGVTK